MDKSRKRKRGGNIIRSSSTRRVTRSMRKVSAQENPLSIRKKYVNYLRLPDAYVGKCMSLAEQYEYKFTGAPKPKEERDCMQNAMAYLGWIKGNILIKHIKQFASTGTKIEWIKTHFHLKSYSFTTEQIVNTERQIEDTGESLIPTREILTSWIEYINATEDEDFTIKPGQATLLFFSVQNALNQLMGHAIVIGIKENGDGYLFDPQNNKLMEYDRDISQYFKGYTILFIEIYLPLPNPKKLATISSDFSQTINNGPITLDELSDLPSSLKHKA